MVERLDRPTNWHFYNENEQQPVSFKKGIREYTGILVGVEEPIVVDYYGYDIPPREMFFLVQLEDGAIWSVNINSFT